jgi:hypothetical protein
MGWVKLTAKEAAVPPKTILCHKLAFEVGATGVETDMVLLNGSIEMNRSAAAASNSLTKTNPS